MTEQRDLPEQPEDGITPELRAALKRVTLGEITAEQAREILGLPERDNDR